MLHRTKVILRYKDIIVWFFICTFCRLSNCQNGIKLARKHFGIPLILNPEHLASSQLDELSCITYLSYFIKIGSPGYNATLQRVRSLLRNTSVSNFTVGWYKKKTPSLWGIFFFRRGWCWIGMEIKSVWSWILFWWIWATYLYAIMILTKRIQSMQLN